MTTPEEEAPGTSSTTIAPAEVGDAFSTSFSEYANVVSDTITASNTFASYAANSLVTMSGDALTTGGTVVADATNVAMLATQKSSTVLLGSLDSSLEQTGGYTMLQSYTPAVLQEAVTPAARALMAIKDRGSEKGEKGEASSGVPALEFKPEVEVPADDKPWWERLTLCFDEVKAKCLEGPLGPQSRWTRCFAIPPPTPSPPRRVMSPRARQTVAETSPGPDYTFVKEVIDEEDQQMRVYIRTVGGAMQVHFDMEANTSVMLWMSLM